MSSSRKRVLSWVADAAATAVAVAVAARVRAGNSDVETPEPVPTPPEPEPVRRRRRRVWWWMAGLAVVLVAAGGGLAVVLTRESEPSRVRIAQYVGTGPRTGDWKLETAKPPAGRSPHQLAPMVVKNQSAEVPHRPATAARTRPPATGTPQPRCSPGRLSSSILVTNTP